MSIKRDKDGSYPPPRKPRLSLIGDGTVRVQVHCSAESHESRPWFIASFFLDDSADNKFPEYWQESGHYWIDGESAADIAPMSRAYLAGDEYLDGDRDRGKPSDIMENNPDATWQEVMAALPPEPERSRCRFHCKLCGITVIRKNEVVMKALAKIAESRQLEKEPGVSNVSLSLLEATMDAVARNG